MIEKNPDAEGNAKFEGFIPELLERISDKLSLDYDLVKVPDGKYGQEQRTGVWNGMIGQVVTQVRQVVCRG